MVRSQYAHSIAFQYTRRVTVRKLSGHMPIDARRIFRNHPGMSEVPEDKQQEYLAMLPKLRNLFMYKGELSEEDLDPLPETEEQAAKRDRGLNVKSDLMDQPWRARYRWDICKRYIERTRAHRAKKLAEDQRAEEQQKQNAKMDSDMSVYNQHIRTTFTKVSAAMREKYSYTAALSDRCCRECKGFYSSWAALDIERCPKTKAWKSVADTTEDWYCGLKSCRSAYTQAGKRLRLRKADARKAEKKKKDDEKKLRAVPMNRYLLLQKTAFADIDSELAQKYQFNVNDDDLSCCACGGWWSTWVAQDLRTLTRKSKTPDPQDTPEEQTRWYCGTKACLVECMAMEQQLKHSLKQRREPAKKKRKTRR